MTYLLPLLQSSLCIPIFKIIFVFLLAAYSWMPLFIKYGHLSFLIQMFRPFTFNAIIDISSIQFSSVAQPCLTLGDPMDCSTPGFSLHHQLLEGAQTHVHWVGDAIQPFHSRSSPSPPAFNLSQDQGLFLWVSSLHQVAKVLELQLQHQSFQWIFRFDFLQDWLIWSPCSPRDSQESSPIPQLKSINSSLLSFL